MSEDKAALDDATAHYGRHGHQAGRGARMKPGHKRTSHAEDATTGCIGQGQGACHGHRRELGLQSAAGASAYEGPRGARTCTRVWCASATCSASCCRTARATRPARPRPPRPPAPSRCARRRPARRRRRRRAPLARGRSCGAAWACRQNASRVFGHCIDTLMRAATHVPCPSRGVRLAGGSPFLPHSVAGMKASAGGPPPAASMRLWQVLWM